MSSYTTSFHLARNSWPFTDRFIKKSELKNTLITLRLVHIMVHILACDLNPGTGSSLPTARPAPSTLSDQT